MGKESSRMEPQPQHQTPDIQTSEKTKKRWEDEINVFLKPEETEETKGNEIKNNDTWIKVAKNRERWTAVESEYVTTEAAASVDSAQEKKSFARSSSTSTLLNGVKLDEYEVANIALLHTMDQTDLD